MKKAELYKKIIEELEENKAPHICCFIEKAAMTFSVRSSADDFYNFLYATLKNIPWAKEVIKDFANDIDDLEKQAAKGVEKEILN